MKYLTDESILGLHMTLVAFFAQTPDPIDPPGPRDMNLLGSAAARPRTSIGDTDKYNGVEAKAAALFHSLVKNHPFHNGNKRTALFSMLAFLEINGRRLSADVTDDDIFDLVVGVAEGTWPTPSLNADEVVDGITQWLNHKSTVRVLKISTMRPSDFIAKCQQAGLRVIEGTGSWRIQSSTGSVKFRKSAKELTGNVVKAYLRRLGLTEGETGVTPDAFQEGLADEADFLRRFQAVLQRLAHA